MILASAPSSGIEFSCQDVDTGGKSAERGLSVPTPLTSCPLCWKEALGCPAPQAGTQTWGSWAGGSSQGSHQDFPPLASSAVEPGKIRARISGLRASSEGLTHQQGQLRKPSESNGPEEADGAEESGQAGIQVQDPQDQLHDYGALYLPEDVDGDSSSTPNGVGSASFSPLHL